MKSQRPKPAMSTLFMKSTMLVRLASCISAGLRGLMSLEANSSVYRQKSFPKRSQGRWFQCCCDTYPWRTSHCLLLCLPHYLREKTQEAACGSQLGFGWWAEGRGSWLWFGGCIPLTETQHVTSWKFRCSHPPLSKVTAPSMPPQKRCQALLLCLVSTAHHEMETALTNGSISCLLPQHFWNYWRPQCHLPQYWAATSRASCWCGDTHPTMSHKRKGFHSTGL